MNRSVSTPRNSWWAQATQNKLVALVLAMVVMVPLAAAPADSSFAGIAAFVMEGFALLLLVALAWRGRANLGREQVLTFLRTGANLPVLLLAAWIALSCALSPHKAFAIQESLKWGAGILLYFVVANHFRQSKHLFLLADTLLFLGISGAIVSLGQYTMQPADRAALLFGNQQLLGSFLMILLPMVAILAFTEKDNKRQLVAQAATVLMTGCLLLAQTRSAWMGTAAGLTTLAALVAFSSRKSVGAGLKAQKHKMVMPAVLAVIAIGFAGLMASQNGSVVERVSSMSSVSGIGTVQTRLQQWQGAVEMIKSSPVMGIGVGNFPLYQKEFTNMGASIPTGSFGTRVSLAEQAHNFYLQTTAELGLIGLLLFVGMVGTFLVMAAKRVSSMDAGIRRNLLIGGMASTVAFSVDAISSPSWQLGQMSMFFWLMMGIGVSCLRPRAKQVEEEAVVVKASVRVVRPLALVGACLAMMLMVLPTAPLAAAPGYNNGNGNGNTVAKIAAISAFVAGVIYFATSRDDDNRAGGNAGGASDTIGNRDGNN